MLVMAGKSYKFSHLDLEWLYIKKKKIYYLKTETNQFPPPVKAFKAKPCERSEVSVVSSSTANCSIS